MNTDELSNTPSSSLPQALTFNLSGNKLVAPNEQYNCLLCNTQDTNPNTLLEHLLQAHSVVIADYNKIANFSKYLNYWKSRLVEKPLSEYTSQIDTRPSPSSTTQVKSYFLLSDILPEDRDIRKELRQQKLEEVLAKQHAERSDTCFEKKCLFCNSLFKGDRSQLISLHKFNIGRPDNLVNIGEFVDILQQRLDNLQCLYCEKTYKSSAVLKQHMRKKKHFKINPKNSIYDSFYVVNYLEPGKNWQELQKELDAEPEPDDEDRSQQQTAPPQSHYFDDVPSDTTYTESGSEFEPDEDADWEDWEEEDDEVSTCVCLFCPATQPSPEQTLLHLKTEHSFDLAALQREWKIDYYDCIKMINCIFTKRTKRTKRDLTDIRRSIVELSCSFCKEQSSSTSDLQQHLTEKGHCKVPQDAPFFKDSQYLFPTYENDSLLTAFDIGNEQGGGASAQEVEQLKKAKEEMARRRAQLARELERMGLSADAELRQLPWGNIPQSVTPTKQPNKIVSQYPIASFCFAYWQ